MKSHHHSWKTWNFNQGWDCPAYNPSLRMSFLRKQLAMFAKGFILNFWLGSEDVCAACLIIIPLYIFYTTFFVTFLFVVTQSFSFSNFSDLPWNSYICTPIGSKIVWERSVTASSLFLHNWLSEIIGIRP